MHLQGAPVILGCLVASGLDSPGRQNPEPEPSLSSWPGSSYLQGQAAPEQHCMASVQILALPLPNLALMTSSLSLSVYSYKLGKHLPCKIVERMKQDTGHLSISSVFKKCPFSLSLVLPTAPVTTTQPLPHSVPGGHSHFWGSRPKAR